MVITTTAAGSAAPPRKLSGSTSGSASDTAATAEARNPARVMPIWMVDRNWLGSRASRATSRPRPPSASRRRSWPSRNEIRATSLPAKAALTTTSTNTSPISAHGIGMAHPIIDSGDHPQVGCSWPGSDLDLVVGALLPPVAASPVPGASHDPNQPEDEHDQQDPHHQGELKQRPPGGRFRHPQLLSAGHEAGTSKPQRAQNRCRDQLIAPADPIRLQGGPQLPAEDGVLADGVLEILDRLQFPLAAAEPGHRRTIRIQQRPGGHALDPADEAAQDRFPPDCHPELRIQAGDQIPHHDPAASRGIPHRAAVEPTNHPRPCGSTLAAGWVQGYPAAGWCS